MFNKPEEQFSRVELEAMLHLAPFGMVLFDLNGRFEYVNNAFAELMGYDIKKSMLSKSSYLTRMIFLLIIKSMSNY